MGYHERTRSLVANDFSGFYFSDIFCGFVFKINKQCAECLSPENPGAGVCCSRDSARDVCLDYIHRECVPSALGFHGKI